MLPDVPDAVLSKRLSIYPRLEFSPFHLIYYSHYFHLCETSPLDYRKKLKYMWMKVLT